MAVWKKLQYQRKGVSHMQSGANCQDRVLVFENESCIVASLADGLGSLKYSEVAAQIATETVCNCFAAWKAPLEQFGSEKELAKHLLDAVVANVRRKAEELAVALQEMDCTLMFVCVLKDTMRAILGRLGDSAVCVIAESNAFAVNDGNRSANGTNAILDQDALEHFELQILDLDRRGIQGFILCSDGLENELYMKGSDHVNQAAELYFNSWFRSVDPLSLIEGRIDQLTEIDGTPFDDDISIAILSRAEKEIVLPTDPKWLCSCGFRNHLQSTYCQQCRKDFSVLYQNIRFRDYGGKAAFFAQINRDPAEELRIIGKSIKGSAPSDPAPASTQALPDRQEQEAASVSEVPPPVETQQPASPTAQEEKNAAAAAPRPSKGARSGQRAAILDPGMAPDPVIKRSAGTYLPKKRRRDPTAVRAVAILMGIALVLGLLLGGLLVGLKAAGRIRVLSENVEQLTNTALSYKAELDKAKNDLSELRLKDFSVLADGAYYWGSLDETGAPHGLGILRMNDVFFIGHFEHGMKNGSFSVIDAVEESRIIDFRDDKRIP